MPAFKEPERNSAVDGDKIGDRLGVALDAVPAVEVDLLDERVLLARGHVDAVLPTARRMDLWRGRADTEVTGVTGLQVVLLTRARLRR